MKEVNHMLNLFICMVLYGFIYLKHGNCML
jgi:hypothetical protein